MDNQQETIILNNINNNLLIIGSSETTCETNIKFLEQFIGFTEGDGSFIINKNKTLEFKITQSSFDAQILFQIKKNLNFGQVSIQDKKNKTHHFRVRNKIGFLKLIQIFNGNLLTEKKNKQFESQLNNFNLIYKEKIKFKINLNKFNLNSNQLCGFTDAEGCFNITLQKRNLNYTQIFVSFILSQQFEFNLLTEISFLIKGKLSYLKSYNGYNLTVNLSNLNLIIKYFKKNKLKTKKYLIFLNQLKIYNLVKKKEHLTLIGLQKIQKLILKRKKFNQIFEDIVRT